MPGDEGVIASNSVLIRGEAMAAELEVVVDRSVGGEELLRVAGRFDPLHLAFPPSGWLM